MKKLILTVIAVAGMSASVLAQGTIAADNNNGTGGPHATSFGLFFLNSSGATFEGGTLNMALLGGSSAGSLSPIGTFAGGTALAGLGGGIYVDQAAGTYTVPNVAAQGTATLQVQAWRGAAGSYGAALLTDQFWAWNGTAYVRADQFTFSNATGGPGSPPATPKSLDGMPAMVLQVPEPSTLALTGLGAALLLFRRRK